MQEEKTTLEGAYPPNDPSEEAQRVETSVEEGGPEVNYANQDGPAATGPSTLGQVSAPYPAYDSARDIRQTAIYHAVQTFGQHGASSDSDIIRRAKAIENYISGNSEQ